MWLKGTLFIIGTVAVLYFGECLADSEETPSSSTIDPDTIDFSQDELVKLLDVFDAATSWPIGKRDQVCSSDADCSAYVGTKCFGYTGCKRCICDPFEYEFSKNDLDDYYDYVSGTDRYWRRSFYDNALSKCLKVLLIDDICEHDDQCPTDGGQRKCDTSTTKCVCKEENDVPVTSRLSCQPPGYKQTCDTTRGCRAGLKCEGDSTKLCQCDNTLYWFDNTGSVGDDAEEACKRHFWDQTCDNNNVHCDPKKGDHDDMQILTCSGTKCECNPDYYILNGSPSPGATGTSACKKVIIGDTGCDGKNGVCYGGHPSSDTHTQTTMCDTNTCKCKEEYPHKVDSMSCRNYGYNEVGCNSKAGTDDEVEDFGSDHDARCGGSRLVCGSGDNENNRCICHNQYPKWDSSAKMCRELNIGESGCKVAVSGWLVDDYGANSDTGRCDVDNAVCDVTGNANGVCKCPENDPVLTAAIDDDNPETCSLIMVGQTGCKENRDTNTEAYDETDNSRCYSGGSTTICDDSTTKGTCKCDPDHPTPSDNNLSCRKSKWNEDCNADGDCESPLTCNTDSGKCVCDTTQKYKDADLSTSERQSQLASVACRRLHYDEGTCRDENDCQTTYLSPSSPGSAVCTANVCKCASTYKHVGNDVCDYEHVHGRACEGSADNNLRCDSNMTCTSGECACKESNNIYDGVKKACRHEDSSYSIGANVACTEDQYSILDLASPGGSNGDRHDWTQTPAVKQCASSEHVCRTCDGTKKCRAYSVPIAPIQNYAARPEMFLSAMILLVIAAIALV